MENMQITQMDGEPPIYREMKPVPVTLESCILNSEEDYPYSQTEQNLVTKDSCVDDELSAEEITSMIMINEGPNALSSVQEELQSSKLNSSIRNSSDIKRILTSDLPKTGRFLSTKSLQKLSGAKKVKKNFKYANEDETDIDELSDIKVKKIINKQNKAVKENVEKTNQDKILEQKLSKKDSKVDKLKIKSQKKGNSLEKLANKKSLKAPKKIGVSKSKDLNLTTKVLKKKVLENNAVVKKKDGISKSNESKTGAEKVDKNSENEKKKSKTETKPKLLISRSGRIRKLKDVSDFVLTKNKESKVLNPTLNPKMATSPSVDESFNVNETGKQSESSSKIESSKESKFQGDLLQNALSESVESWFDLSPDNEKKGKRTRGILKIIPKDYDSFFEETEYLPVEKSYEKTISEESERIQTESVKSGEIRPVPAETEEIRPIPAETEEIRPVPAETEEIRPVPAETEEIRPVPAETEEKTDSAKSEFPKDEQKEVVNKPNVENKEIEEDAKKLQNVNETSEDFEKDNNLDLNIRDTEPDTEEEKIEEEKKSEALNGKKIKTGNKQLLGYKKKRRKPRNITVSSYLKNYGERIDFEVKLDPDEAESMKPNVHAKDVAEEAKTVQKKSVKDVAEEIQTVKEKSVKDVGEEAKTAKKKSVKDVAEETKSVKKKSVKDVGEEAKTVKKKSVKDVGEEAKTVKRKSVKDVAEETKTVKKKSVKGVDEETKTVKKKSIKDVGEEEKSIQRKSVKDVAEETKTVKKKSVKGVDEETKTVKKKSVRDVEEEAKSVQKKSIKDVDEETKNVKKKSVKDVEEEAKSAKTVKRKSVKDVAEETKTAQRKSLRDGNSNNLEKKKKSEAKSTESIKAKEKKSKNHITTPVKRSQSAESLHTSCEPKIESPTKSAEMPASLPSREKELNLEKNDSPEFPNEKATENQEDQNKTMQKKEMIEEKMTTSEESEIEARKQNESQSETIVSPPEEPKTEKSEDVTEAKLEVKDEPVVVQKRGRGRPRKSLNPRVITMKNNRKQMWAIARKEKLALRKARKELDKNQSEDEPKNDQDSDKETTGNTNKEDDSITEKKSEMGDSFSPSSALSMPLKKRPRRQKTIDTVDELGKENKEETKTVQKQDCERRKSHREIKLTPKIVDMIATSTCYRRSRKVSSSKEETPVSKEEPDSFTSDQKPVEESETKNSVPEQPLATVPSVENYLQSKMEANASNFESNWEPGDLVWARFAGNPFWPALILRDPFCNDEYSRVKYLGRLPRPFVHVQFLADYGRRAWGPELYIMSFNGLKEFEELKSNLPEVNAYTQRKDLVYQQAFFTPKKMEKHWMDAIKEAETLLNKSKDERITYMKIKYPLVKYAASVTNGRLVPNERTKSGDSKSPQSKIRKRKSMNTSSTPDGKTNDWPGTESEDTLSKDTFECVNTSDMDEGTKKSEKDSPKITLKLVRSPKKGSKRKSSKSIDEIEEKKFKKRIKKEALDEDYVPSDSGSNGEKGPEAATSKQKKYFLFKGARAEKVCQICLEILENEKTVKCKGACLGLFHKSCAEKMSADLPPLEEGTKTGVKNKRRKKLFAYEDGDNSVDSQSKDSTEKEWRCNDCIRGNNPCFVCNTRSGNRQRCCVANCGKFYHQKCLKLYPQTIYNQGAPIRKFQSLQQSKTTESESPHYQILSCPLHVCHTCASDNPADFNMKYLCEKLVKCIKCPSAYHGGNFCVPAGSTILNTSQIICAKHGDPGKKSHVNISWCFICNMGGSLICCEWCPSSFHLDCLNIKPPDGPYICEECESGRFPLYGEVVWVKLGRYRWWPARVLFPQEILPNIMALPHKPWEFAVRFYGSNDHYWLNRGRVFLYQEGDSEQKFKGQSHVDKIYQRAVQEATKDYFAIQGERKSRLLGTNTSGVMKPPPYVKIKTNKPVGKVQLGNPSQSEPQTCDCDPNSEAPCSPGSVCLNRMLLVECNPNYCNAGSRCGNQSFEKREYPPLEPYRTERRGWGLRSPIDIPKGSFVIEYVGEVVDDEEFKRRMKRKQETKDSNYYFLTIDKDRMIDAGPKGNLARFMNHSCSPNCETQKWTVNGDTRVGLFALRDIPAGTELTFNYNLDCIGNEKKPCHCEEENCSGFIGVKAKNDKSEAHKNKMMKRLEKESEDECFVCNDGGELMVCDLPNCPKVYHLECVNLTEWPNEMWFCPRHKCFLCKRTTKRCCRLCPTAFCFAHLDNNLFSDNQGGILCSRHSTYAVKPAQTLRKASYINRNTPVVEYEKPFAEKYRPPPQKERTSPEEKKEEILMEPNLTDNTPIVVENPLLSSSSSSRLNDGVSVQVLYVDEEGQIISVDGTGIPNPEDVLTGVCEAEILPKPIKRKKRTNIPRKKLNPPVVKEETENKQKSPAQGGINFESLMIKSVEDKILDSKLNMDNIYNIIGGGGEGGTGQTDGAERCIRDDSNEVKPETVNKKEDAEVDRSRRSKYFKIITPEKFIKVTESEPNQKKVTDFNYIEFMHPLRSARSKTKTDENTRK